MTQRPPFLDIGRRELIQAGILAGASAFLPWQVARADLPQVARNRTMILTWGGREGRWVDWDLWNPYAIGSNHQNGPNLIYEPLAYYSAFADKTYMWLAESYEFALDFINNFDEAAGFWTDNNGHEHGFVVELNLQSPSSSTFIEIPPTTFPGAIATQASDITNNDLVCGFWTDANNNNHGFFGFLGQTFLTFDVKINRMTATSTSPLGCNDEGEIVGSFTDPNGNVHGFIFVGKRFFQFDAPGSSQTPAFAVAGTIINGVNNRGDIVGFFSDGTNVNGFVNFALLSEQDEAQN